MTPWLGSYLQNGEEHNTKIPINSSSGSSWLSHVLIEVVGADSSTVNETNSLESSPADYPRVLNTFHVSVEKYVTFTSLQKQQ